MSDCRKCVTFDWCKENEECGLFKPKTMRNADRIRAMTDEELADWLIMNGNGSDYQTWLEWLKSEVSES